MEGSWEFRVRSSRVLTAFLLALLPSCVLDWSGLRDRADASSSGDDSGADTGAADVAPDTASCVPKLVINELKADGVSANDEFVEIYNDATCTASLLGYTIQYSSATGSAPNTSWTGTADDTIDAKGYFLVGGDGFTPPANTKAKKWTSIAFPMSGLLSKNGGGIGLFGPSSKLLDAVAYATLSTPTHPFIRPATLPDGGASTPAPNPPTNQSISRVPNGATTDVNAVDFKVTAAPTPGAAN
jgi:5'-nucleotidase